MHSFIRVGSLVALAGIATPAMGQSASWNPVELPSFGLIRDSAVDIDAHHGPAHVLIAAQDNTIIGGDQHFHVLRRQGNGWIDLGEPDVAAIEAASFGNEGVTWTALAVGPGGEIWLGGEHEALAQVNRGYQRPVFAVWRPNTGWSEPESHELFTVVVHPFSPRGGSVYDMDVAPDGTVFATGISSGWGGLVENNGSIPMLLAHDGSAWLELNVPDRDWPGSRGATDANRIVAFAADSILAAGRHPGGNGVGQGALIMSYDPASGPVFVETPAFGGGNARMVANAIAARGPSDVWVVGEGSTAADTSLLMHFDGSDWTLHASPFPSIQFLQNVVLLDDATAWAFTGVQRDIATGAGIPQAFFNGATWETRPFYVPAEPGVGLQVLSTTLDGDGVAWTCGRTLPNGSAASSIAFVARYADVPCPADTNADGQLSPADFNAWILAFNAGTAACDQNNDGLCSPSDFNAWIANFNTGC